MLRELNRNDDRYFHNVGLSLVTVVGRTMRAFDPGGWRVSTICSPSAIALPEPRGTAGGARVLVLARGHRPQTPGTRPLIHSMIEIKAFKDWVNKVDPCWGFEYVTSFILR